MITKLRALLLAAVIAVPSITFGQDWVTKMNDPNVNFFEVQNSFNKYAAKKDREIERERKRASKRNQED